MRAEATVVTVATAVAAEVAGTEAACCPNQTKESAVAVGTAVVGAEGAAVAAAVGRMVQAVMAVEATVAGVELVAAASVAPEGAHQRSIYCSRSQAVPYAHTRAFRGSRDMSGGHMASSKDPLEVGLGAEAA